MALDPRNRDNPGTVGSVPEHINGFSEPGPISGDIDTGSFREDTSTILHGGIPRPEGAGLKARELVFEYLSRQHGQMQECYFEIRRARELVKEAWDRFRRFHQAYQEARWLYDATIDPVSAQYAFPSSVDRMNALRQGLQDARDNAEQQFVEAKDLEARFKLTEERLERKQGKFHAAAERFMMLATSGPGDDMFSDLDSEAEFPVSPLSVHSAASQQLDPRAKRYYDRASDVKVMGERLAELDQHYRETRILRSMREDQDEELSVTDSDFEAEHSRKRGVIEVELTLAAEAADELRAECLELGINIESKRPNATDTEGITDPSTGDQLQTQYEGTVIPFPPSVTGPVFSETGEFHFDDMAGDLRKISTLAAFKDLSLAQAIPDISGWRDRVKVSAHLEPEVTDTIREAQVGSTNGATSHDVFVADFPLSKPILRRRASEPAFRQTTLMHPGDRQAILNLLQAGKVHG